MPISHERHEYQCGMKHGASVQHAIEEPLATKGYRHNSSLAGASG